MEFPIKHLLRPPTDWQPTLTVVIDTEEEFDWSAPFDPGATATTNIAHQPLAQAIFDRAGLVPTYVIDYPVAESAEAQTILKPMLEQGRCEIGAHLHPWVTPPHQGPIDNFHSYPGNLPHELERQKLAALTRSIEEHLEIRPTIYKAGRYGIGPATAGLIAELGFRIDVSVVPHTSFLQNEGPDFTAYPDYPFSTAHGLLELPMSVGFAGAMASGGAALYPRLTSGLCRKLRLPGVFSRLKLLERLRLSPEGHNLDDLYRLTRASLARGQRLFMLTYHSSSLLPGATSYVRDAAERQAFIETIEGYVDFFMNQCGGKPSSVTDAARMLC